MPATLAISVSALEEDWFRRSFYPALDTAIEAAQVTWIVVDHSDEGDILLRSYCLARPRRRIREVRVEENDPAMVWTDLVGTADEPGVFARTGDVEGVFLYGGALLHHQILAGWKPALEALCGGWGRAVVAPIHRRTMLESPGLVRGGGRCATIEVPDFRSTSRAVRVALADDLLREVSSGLTPADLADALIERNPASRTELQRWVEHCAQGGESGDGASLPLATLGTLPRVHSFPRAVKSKASLAAKLEIIRANIAETDRAYADWRNEPLIFPIQEALEPFAFHDPRSWFVSGVSYAACQYFDAADPAILSLSQLTVGEDGLLRFEREPDFFRDLRALRTFFQHGLDLRSDKNRTTYDTVIAWFRARCGTDVPAREHWRELSASFLESWHEVSERMARVARRIPHAQNREQIERELDKISARLPEWRWRQIVQAAAADLGIETDPGAFLRIHLQALVEEMRRAAPNRDAFESVARRLADARLLAMADLPPVDGGDFIASGVTRGPRIGEALRLAREEWLRDRSMSKAALITRVLERLGPQRGSSGE